MKLQKPGILATSDSCFCKTYERLVNSNNEQKKQKVMRKLFFIPIIGLFMMFTGCPVEEVEEPEKVYEKKAKVAVLVADGFHDGEAYMPIGYLANKGIYSVVIGPEKGVVKAYNSDFTIKIHKAVEDVSVDYFDALIIPGGHAPSKLREYEEIVDWVKEFYKTGKTIAAICHGPQVLITAGVLEGKKATGFGGIKEELEEAGVVYKDKSVVIDENIITSRTPPDLYDFSRAIAKNVMPEKWEKHKIDKKTLVSG